MPFETTSPVGRLVQGDPMTPYGVTKTVGGVKQPVTDPATGKQAQAYFFAVAFDKNNPEWQALYGQMWQEARAGFPHLFDPQTGACKRADFSWKVIDGDGHDQNGQPYSDKEGFAGHYVVRFNSQFPTKCFHKGKYDPMQQIQNPQEVKRGYYVRVGLTCKPNTGDSPGIYVNPTMLELFGYGPEIVGGANAAAVFGQAAAPTYIPQGMSAAPTMAAPGMQPMAPAPGMQHAPQPMAPAPGMQHAPQPMAPAPGMQQQQPMAPMTAAPGMQVAQPNPGFVANAITPQYQMTATAQGYTREQWNAQGYDDTYLINNGMMMLA